MLTTSPHDFFYMIPTDLLALDIYESARKQADLPVAKSAQDTGTSQVLESLKWSAAQSRLTTHISNYPEARKG